jgi:hypothetical protein
VKGYLAPARLRYPASKTRAGLAAALLADELVDIQFFGPGTLSELGSGGGAGEGEEKCA